MQSTLKLTTQHNANRHEGGARFSLLQRSISEQVAFVRVEEESR